jgi:hypothetical protein
MSAVMGAASGKSYGSYHILLGLKSDAGVTFAKIRSFFVA